MNAQIQTLKADIKADLHRYDVGTRDDEQVIIAAYYLQNDEIASFLAFLDSLGRVGS